MPAAMKMNLTGDWRQTGRTLAQARARMTRALDTATRAEAEDVRKQMLEGIRKQAPAGEEFLPISRLTRALRRARGFRGSKALIKTASMMNSITVSRAGRGRYFVGIKRSARGRRNEPLINIALIHEEGRTYVMRVTPRQRRFIMMALRQAGMLRKKREGSGGESGFSRGYVVVTIPARPFMSPVIRKVRSNPGALRNRIGRRVARELGYTLGR